MHVREHFFPRRGYFFLLMVVLGCTPSYGQWKELGPNGGGAHVIAVAPSQPDFMVVATRNALIYKSTDQALSWQQIPFDRSFNGILNTLVIDNCNAQTWYVGLTNSGVYKTT